MWNIKSLLSTIGVSEEKHKKVRRFWTPLLITLLAIFLCIICSLYFLDNFFPELSEKELNHLKQEALVMSLVVCSHLLVVVDTSIFLIEGDIITLNTDFTDMNEDDKKKIILKKKGAVYINILTILASGIIIFLYVLKLFGIKEIDFEMLFKANEVVAVFIFLLFCIADSLYLSALKISINHTNNNTELNKIKKLLSQALLLIDVVGLFGIIIITIFSFWWGYHINHFFVEGFALGAIAFHIIFTQFNWAYLRTKAEM